ncbi:MAG TPA: hypothetical protein VGA78_06825 [Gemmatimonadales bacterium]
MIAPMLLLVLQQWNSPDALALVEQAIQRRRQSEAGLARYTSQARGVVLFQVQVGAGDDAPLQLIKADELAVEVYWEAPNRSKQTVKAWRERRFLPTDIQYHRDHLGVVTDDFGDVIRVGEGDEVRNVPHPLSPGGPEAYDYALGDSLTLASGAARLTVREVLVRPREPSLPRAAGTMFLDAGSADLVRFRFSFTGPAYLQAQLEDITVVLERALFDQRYWLPWRQEIEIRRRLSWLDFPFRTIIRGRWEIDDYDVAAAIIPGRLAGGPYGGLRSSSPDTGWAEPLDSAIARSGGNLARADLDRARTEVARLVTAAARAGQPPSRLALSSVSNLGRVNRVQGLALGAGATLRPGGGIVELRPRVGYGFSNRRLTGGAELSVQVSPVRLTFSATRETRDLSDWPAISGGLNSILAQEAGQDHGDWVLLDRLMAGLRWQPATLAIFAEAGVETSRSLGVSATPARGSYRPNPPLGDGSIWTGRLGFTSRWRSRAGRVFTLAATVEAGDLDRGYLRTTLETSARVPRGTSILEFQGRAGWSNGAVPAWRNFVLGGRGTLPGESFRAFGGSRMALARLEWRVPVTLPSPGLPGWVAAASGVTIAPFAAVGWSDEAPAGLPWTVTDGLRPVLGVASELLFNVLRLEAGWAPRAGRWSVILDASPSWWPVL